MFSPHKNFWNECFSIIDSKDKAITMIRKNTIIMLISLQETESLLLFRD